MLVFHFYSTRCRRGRLKFPGHRGKSAAKCSCFSLKLARLLYFILLHVQIVSRASKNMQKKSKALSLQTFFFHLFFSFQPCFFALHWSFDILTVARMHTHAHTHTHTLSLSSPRGLLGACGSNCRPSHHWSLGAGIQLLAGLTLHCSDDSDADSDERNRVAGARRKVFFLNNISVALFHYPKKEKQTKERTLLANQRTDFLVAKESRLLKATKMKITSPREF